MNNFWQQQLAVDNLLFMRELSTGLCFDKNRDMREEGLCDAVASAALFSIGV